MTVNDDEGHGPKATQYHYGLVLSFSESADSTMMLMDASSFVLQSSTMRLVLVLSLLVTCVSAADKPLAEAAKEAAKAFKAGGIVSGESLGGKVSYASAGSPLPQPGIPPEDILFEIGSITKVFTGLLLAQAVVDGRVTLETSIASLLPPNLEFADPRIAAITLKQLSTHTSGLPRLPDNQDAGSAPDDPYAHYDEKLMLDFLTTAHLEKDGPHLSSYSNLGVGLLGHLLGKVYQSTWEQAVIIKICAPLGLNDTRMTITRLKRPLAPPHDGDKPSHSWTFDAVAGAGGLRSTAADMIKFGQAMAHPEMTPLAQAFALALQPQAKAGAMGGKIGLGIFIGQRDGIPFYNHDGGTGGYRSGLQVIPQQDIVRVVLINNTTPDGSSVIAKTHRKPPRVMPKEIALSAEVLKTYPGIYELETTARFTVLLHEGQLWIRLTGQTFLPAFPSAPARFFLKVVPAEFQFTSEGSKVKSVTLFQNGRELVANRTNDPLPQITLRKAEQLKPYTGKFALMGMKNLTITIKSNTLFAQLEGQPPAPVFETAKDRFEYEVVKAVLTFTRDDKDQITGLMLTQNGLNIPAARQP